jgi:hypothetical protein
MGHRTGVEVIACERNGAGQRSLTHQAIDFQAEFGAFAMPEPSDSSWQTLEGHALARELHPIRDDMVGAELTQQQIIDLPDIVRIT